jgi:hypothetical protein
MRNDAGLVFVNEWDDSVQCMELPPLYPSQMERRRVTFPQWLVEEPCVGFAPEWDGNPQLEIVV